MGRTLTRRLRLVDPRLQGKLCLRIALYWLCCLISTTAVLCIWPPEGDSRQSLAASFAQVWQQHALAIAIAQPFLLLTLLDLLITSNRLAGPLRQIRQGLKQLADGQELPPIGFRNGDFYPDIAYEFNRVARRLQILSHDPFPSKPPAEQSGDNGPNQLVDLS